MDQSNKFVTNTPLPSIEQFQLDFILNDVLRNESDQVINDLLKVTSNYQNDLRKEIKYKLSIEQRIQFKNIEIAKLSKNLNQLIQSRNKKLSKALLNYNNDDEIEVNQLLKHTIESSNKIKDIITRLKNIEKRKCKESIVVTKRELYPNLYKLVNLQTESHGEQNSEVNKDVIVNEEINNDAIMKEEVNKDQIVDEQLPTTEIDEIQDQNGLNISSSIPIQDQNELNIGSSTPNQKRKEVSNLDQSTPIQEAPTSMDPIEFETFMASTIAKYRERQQEESESESESNPQTNPLNLLYSQLIITPIKSYPFSNLLSIKSTATVDESSQISHYKKLRINGAPITSESFKKKEDLSEIIDNLKIIDDDEVWNSSGLNTENSSSNSSDSVSENEIDQYYSNLEMNLKRKRKLEGKDLSPTPKHKPSHHILKPKRSILKTKQQKTLNKPAIINHDHHEITPLSAVNNAYGSKTVNVLSEFTVSGIITNEEEPINILKKYS
ncbi:unnamed protein product [Candida verbasci]|uniref:Uncharacterized protein n=1 Tax=Candida verbasci TaxID=1227364 RepID=A0A9W4U0B2_9ASCO|nr:unnamed protein product [Candida verbasci]